MSKPTSSTCIFFTIIALILLCATAYAQGPGPGPCAQDVQKLCAGVQPGGGRIVQCLHEHATKLSPACSARMQQPKETHANGQNRAGGGCRTDIEQFCKNVQPGQGRILACLRNHQNELSQACQTMMANRPNQGRHQ